eukprot:1161855-Pelagomonas_calceolata.AAC.5
MARVACPGAHVFCMCSIALAKGHVPGCPYQEEVGTAGCPHGMLASTFFGGTLLLLVSLVTLLAHNCAAWAGLSNQGQTRVVQASSNGPNLGVGVHS